jgi:hypothetical protein
LPVILVAAVPEEPPVIPPVTTGTDQLYVVPVGTNPFVTFAGVEVNDDPLQAEFVIEVIAGLGFTVTVNVNVVPKQVPEVGVTV